MDVVVRNFHRAIIKIAKEKLGRDLTKNEEVFVISREGLIALEMIQDTVKSETREHIEKYLNSENDKQSSK